MKAFTSVGVARLLMRCIRANFPPENQVGEIEKLADYLESLCSAREDETDSLVRRDSDFLFAIVRELEEG